MRRVYLPILPLPVLASLVAFGACSRPREEPALHVIPPPTAYVAPAASAAPGPAAAPKAEEPTPSADDVREFERAVPK
jgi:hypothetical protein